MIRVRHNGLDAEECRDASIMKTDGALTVHNYPDFARLPFLASKLLPSSVTFDLLSGLLQLILVHSFIWPHVGGLRRSYFAHVP